MAILLGAIALVAVIGYMFYSLGSNLLSEEYQGKLLKLAQQRLENKKDDYMKEVQALVDTAAPRLKDAFYKQSQEDMPKYQAAFGKERDAFTKSIEAQLKKQVNDQYKKAAQEYVNKLATEFPELEKSDLKDKAFKAILDAYESLVEEYYVTALAEGLDDIYKKWDEFPSASESDLEPGETKEGLLIGRLLELVSKKMAN